MIHRQRRVSRLRMVLVTLALCGNVRYALANEACLQDRLPSDFLLAGSLGYVVRDGRVKFNLQLMGVQSGGRVIESVQLLYGAQTTKTEVIELGKIDDLKYEVRSYLGLNYPSDPKEEDLTTTFYVDGTQKRFALAVYLMPSSANGIQYCGTYYVVSFDVAHLVERTRQNGGASGLLHFDEPDRR